MSLRNFIIKSVNYNWKIVSKDIGKKLNKIGKNSKKKFDPRYIVIFPHYEKDTFMVEESGGKKKKIGKVSEKYLEKDREVVMNNG